MDGEYHSVYGKERVRWEADGDRITLEVSIPPNTSAALRLDGAREVLEADGLDFYPREGYMEAEAGSGVYRVRFLKK